jgi:hypothetical protein
MSTAENTAGKQKQAKPRGKPFKKGTSGNPAGRPKGSVSITEAIKRKLEEVFIPPGTTDEERNKIKRTHLEAIVDTVMENALILKDPRTIKDVWNYIDGLPKATIEVGGDKESLETLTEYFKSVAKKK